MDEQLFAYSIEDLRLDAEKQKEVFRTMIQSLESEGRCRFVFHTLGMVLFGENFEQSWSAAQSAESAARSEFNAIVAECFPV